MTVDMQSPSSGLVFLGMRDIDIVATCNSVGSSLEANDHRGNSTRITSETAARIMATGSSVGLAIESGASLEALPDESSILQIRMTPNFSDAAPDAASAEVILAMVTRHLALGMAPSQVRWLASDALLDTNAFLDAFNLVRPRRVRPVGPRHMRPVPPRPVLQRTALAPPDMALAQSQAAPMAAQPDAPRSDQTAATAPRGFPEVESSLDRLNTRVTDLANDGPLRAVFLTDDTTAEALAPHLPGASPAMRLASWMLAISVGLFALPVAAALVVLNMLRGEDLRRAAQAMALTGTFLSLDSTGATAQTLSALTSLVS